MVLLCLCHTSPQPWGPDIASAPVLPTFASERTNTVYIRHNYSEQEDRTTDTAIMLAEVFQRAKVDFIYCWYKASPEAVTFVEMLVNESEVIVDYTQDINEHYFLLK
jgi:hypothetical protein